MARVRGGLHQEAGAGRVLAGRLLDRWIPNLYLLSTNNDSPDEVIADGYERNGEDWVFHLAGAEVARIPVDAIVSITRTRV